MSKQKFTLNKDQERAVTHKSGPLLVVAGAGTGKTRVITERIKHLIQKEGVSPTSVLAVTFTEKASKEMLDRLDKVMPLGYEEPWVYTFHSFADRLLTAEGLEIGLDPSYKIIAYPQQWLLIRKHLFDFNFKYFLPLGNPTKFISALLKFISRLQDEYITPQDLAAFAKSFDGDKEEKERWLELSNAYSTYQELKLAESKMDFGDLITWTIRLFKERPNILKKYQKQFKHTLVDEFQDTNYAQYELIKLLFPSEVKNEAFTKDSVTKDSTLDNSIEGRSLLVVGDDSQSIYKFRGAAVSNILEFIKDYPTSDMVTLLQNYRSTQQVLDPSYTLVQNNNPDTLESKLNISKQLQSMVGVVEEISDADASKFPTPKIILTDTLEDEVDYVVSEIIKILGSETHYTYKDIAILARANSHLEPFVMALRKHGLPYQLVGNRGLYDRDEVRDILAFLKVVVNPNDGVSLFRVLNMVSLEIPPFAISKILSEVKYRKSSMWELVQKSSNEKIISLREKLQKFQKDLVNKTPTEFVYNIVHENNYLSLFLKEETIENQLCINNLNLFLDRIKQFEVDWRTDTGEIPTVVDFLDYLELVIEAGESPAQAEIQDIDTINLLTVHASKGLEFGVVFMVNLVSGRFPTRNRKDPIQIPEELIKETLPAGDPHIQEERRLFYVGMTRAQKYLYLMNAKNYGGKRDKAPSGYLAETKLKTTKVDAKNAAARNDQESLFGVNSDFRQLQAVRSGEYIPYSLSFSKISTYKTCPLMYKYRYVLNIPTPPSHALSFGISIHDTLRDFHMMQLAKPVSLDGLLQMYKDNWHPDGYLDKKHQNLRFESGKNLLEHYYKKNQNMKAKPIELEKSFNIKIGGIKFFGRIDRIDKLPNGDIEIVDYKTGKLKDQKAIDKDEQVAFYALAAQRALNLTPQKLSYYFVEHDQKISTTRTQEQLEKTENAVEEVVIEMKKGNFAAKPGMQCKWCDFKDICPSAFNG